MDALERMKSRIPEAADGSRDGLLSGYLEDAMAYILNVTGRKVMPQQLLGAQVQLATIYYNRQGIEGEQLHSAGGVSRRLYGVYGNEDMPTNLRQQVLGWRLLNVAQRVGE